MKTDRRDPEEELVTLAGPADQKDVTYLTGAGPLRFLEGRSTHGVPLRIARELAGPGWQIEPLVVLQEGTYEGGTK